MMRELLHAITTAQINNEPMRVSHLMRDPAHGTFPTISAKLKKLVDGGWVERRGDSSDKRSVLLEATPKTLEAFDSISNALDSL
ncbi:MAG: winged helix DNA-binding protein [Aestuariivirga sp.]|uniref:winged helix DNA-binding protein n=1 Tax=Aestuariivirga sp. TaxID=2650926 RepID=UPI0025B857C1|nr:winged helix DNA-binding protein [Aestuariivirga sp.]MCA3561283.1 winged helix DNA-binding protein [Aestuariivirga sp.]